MSFMLSMQGGNGQSSHVAQEDWTPECAPESGFQSLLPIERFLCLARNLEAEFVGKLVCRSLSFSLP